MKRCKKILSLVLALLCLSVFLTSCGEFGFFKELFGKAPADVTTAAKTESKEPEPFPIIVDGVEIAESPARIISLSPFLSEILFEFDSGSRLIGKSEYCDFPRELLEADSEIIATLPVLDLDIDTMISLRPDLILLSSPISEKNRLELEKQGIPVLIIPAPESLDSFRNVYKIMGTILYGAFVGANEGESVFSAVTLTCNNPDVVNIGDFVYVTENMSLATGDTLESSVFSCFGNNLAKNSTGYVFDKAELLQNQPDIILLSDVYTVEDLLGDAVFSQLDAVKERRVIILGNQPFERPSLRVVGVITDMQIKFKDMKNQKEIHSETGE
ncbi:MAG: ABC transporter substrate-binding protein [Oscillospiraceae bacterium]|nr:ABC transporter substrate-binding protein [Oscillospiraceae bacterium]